MVSEQRLKKKEAVKDSILEATRAILISEGWQAVSIRKIADAIGYSLPIVYNHFENKDAIQEEFVKIGFGMLTEVIQIAKEKSQFPAEQLIHIAHTYFEFAFAKREYYQLMFGLGMPNCERARQVAEIGRFGDLVIQSIQELSNPVQTAEILRLKFHTFWSILHGLSSINMVNIAATPDEMQQRVLLDAIQGFIKNINN